MNIVVLGAGTVGTGIAELLCQGNHSVTVIDSDPERVRAINERLDVRAISGSGSQSSALFQAGVSTAEICFAVTGDDEVNIIGASMAKAMGVRRAIARVYSPVFRDLSTFDYQQHFNVDRMLSLEYLTALELARGIRAPGSVVLEKFSRGELKIQEISVTEGCQATKSTVRELGLTSHIRFGTIRRGNKMWIAAANDQLEAGDQVSVFCHPDEVKLVKSLFRQASPKSERVVIVGGGETGFQLARTLEREGYRVMLIESDPQRAKTLATQLDSTMVIQCDATQGDNLEEERVGHTDYFVACTGKDEDNLILCVRARDLGAKKVMATISKQAYNPMISRLGIDGAVSHKEVMSNELLSFLNTGVIIRKSKLPGGLVNILEIETMPGSPATVQPLAKLGLPERCLVVAFIRHDHVRIPTANEKIPEHSKVILLAEEDVEDAVLSKFDNS